MADVINKPPMVRVAAPRRSTVDDPLFEYLLRLADDRLVLGHRLSEWCGHAPIIEEDIAMSNIALDLVGQAGSLLTLAAEAEGRGRDSDRLAFFRDEVHYRNCLLVEQSNGDFARTMLRQFLFDAFSVLLWEQLRRCAHDGISPIAEKAIKEDRYHLRHSSEWVVMLGDGTEESHSRAQNAADELWWYTDELFDRDEVDEAVLAHGIVVDHGVLRASWYELVGEVFSRATMHVPQPESMRRGGRRGFHTEHLGHMLATMQSVARAHPGASW